MGTCATDAATRDTKLKDALPNRLPEMLALRGAWSTPSVHRMGGPVCAPHPPEKGNKRNYPQISGCKLQRRGLAAAGNFRPQASNNLRRLKKCAFFRPPWTVKTGARHALPNHSIQNHTEFWMLRTEPEIRTKW